LGGDHGKAAKHRCDGGKARQPNPERQPARVVCRVRRDLRNHPETGKVPADLDEQCRLMFENVRRVMTAAGGSPDDIVKMTVWITDRSLREIMNRHWVAMFPDPQSRPARHTLTSRDFTAPMQIQCDLMAVLGEC